MLGTLDGGAFDLVCNRSVCIRGLSVPETPLVTSFEHLDCNQIGCGDARSWENHSICVLCGERGTDEGAVTLSRRLTTRVVLYDRLNSRAMFQF